MSKTAKTAKNLTATDLKRHQIMLARYQEAQDLQEQMGALARRQADLLGAFRVWSEELHERYDLSADLGEGVEEDGKIIRKRPQNR